MIEETPLSEQRLEENRRAHETYWSRGRARHTGAVLRGNRGFPSTRFKSWGQGSRKGHLGCALTLPRVQRGGPDLAAMLAAFYTRYRRRGRQADRRGPT